LISWYWLFSKVFFTRKYIKIIIFYFLKFIYDISTSKRSKNIKKTIKNNYFFKSRYHCKNKHYLKDQSYMSQTIKQWYHIKCHFWPRLVGFMDFLLESVLFCISKEFLKKSILFLLLFTLKYFFYVFISFYFNVFI
jgi:hypothetical protein